MTQEISIQTADRLEARCDERQDSEVREQVRDYYGGVLTSSEDLASNACCAAGAPPRRVAEALRHVHPDVAARFYGCGFPIPEALEGCRVLDLGCGTGRDVYVLSQLVGPHGHVIGVDMTEKQLEIAQATLSWHMQRFGYESSNVSLHLGTIEDLASLGIEEGSIDVVISNCVVNLSPRKDRVLDEVFRVLAPGGEFYFSDVFADRRLPSQVVRDPLLFSECLGGALYEADFRSMARRSGFRDPREVERAPISIRNPEVLRRVGAARFDSVTLRLLALADLDDGCEDYGQVATYRGGIGGAEAAFRLDDHHLFEVGRPERVCGNTAAMLSRTRFARFFEVLGDRSVHFGAYPCEPTLAARQARVAKRRPEEEEPEGACCQP
jgi:ubiquinone/menaquinone biosynthesis C-methylase UbiE